MQDYWKAITVSATWIAGCSVADHYGDASAIVTGGNRGVHARLPLDADDARLFIQDGAIAGRGEVDRHRVSCAIKPSLARRGDSGRPTRLGLAVHRDRGLGFPTHSKRGSHADDLIDPPIRLDYFTEMEIRSDLQPQVNELPCRYRGDRIQDAAPEPEAIGKEFGGLGSLQSPVGASDQPRD